MTKFRTLAIGIVAVVLLLENLLLIRGLNRQQAQIQSLGDAISERKSLPQTVASQFQLQNSILERGLNNQAAILNRAVGKWIPTMLPDDVLNNLAAKETLASDPTKWPETASAARDLLKDLANITKSIPPWAEEDVLPRLNRLRWNVEVGARIVGTDRLDGDELAKAIDDLKSLEAATPEDGSTAVSNRLSQSLKILEDRATKLRRLKTIDAAKEATKDISLGKVASALTALDSISGPDDETKALTNALRQHVLERQAELQCNQLRAKYAKSIGLADEQLRQAAVSQVYESVLSERINLEIEGIQGSTTEGSLMQLMKDCENSLRGVALKRQSAQQAEQAAKLRAYQKWTLQQIKAFRDDYASVEQAVAQEDAKHWVGTKPGWQEANFLAVRDAMVRELLPINTSLLEQAVGTFYSQAYDMGWNKIREGGDKIYVAEQAAVVVKQQPDTLK